MAQSSGSATPGASSEIEEIVVTARKREESLQLVPVSVTAVSGADLEARSLFSLKDVAQFTPNFSISNMGQAGSSVGLVYIRGIGQSDPLVTNEPGVGIYLDGVYFGRMQGLDLAMMDLERIEILRGPQGTLFGKNTIGGAVNIVSMKPTNEFSGRGQVTAGSDSRLDAGASINFPLVTDKLAARVSVSKRNTDGFGRNGLGDEMGNIDNLSARGVIMATPNENLELLLAADGTRIREKGPVRKVLDIQASPVIGLLNMLRATVLQPPGPPFDNRWLTDDDFTSHATDGNLNNVDLKGVSLTATWKKDAYSIKSTTAYRKNDSIYGVDPDGSPIIIIDETGQTSQHQFSQELQVNGVSFDDKLSWVAGAFYFQEKADMHGADKVMTDLYTTIGLDIGFNTILNVDNKAYALYGQGSYEITDRLGLTAGLRYTSEDKSGNMYRYRPLSGQVVIPYVEDSKSWDAFSPRIGLEYKWTPDVMTYVSAAQGFKSGGFNGQASAADGFTSYDPETVWTFEAGLRSDLLDNRVRLNATVFLSKYQDIQFTVIKGSEQGEPISTVDNAGKADIKGAEIELVAVPAEGLTLNAALGLTDAEYTEVNPTADITTSSHFIKTPKWTYTLGVQYVMPVSDSFELVGRLDYAYKSTIYHDAANSPLIVQDGYPLLNARISLGTMDNGWNIAVFGTNLTDERYIMAGTDFLNSLGFAEVQYGRPREYGVSLEYKW